MDEHLNPLERAAAKCNISVLQAEIDSHRSTFPDFQLSDFIKLDQVISLMRKETQDENNILSMLQFLIGHGINVSDSESGKTTLMYEAAFSAKTCELLLNHGADINYVDEKNNNSLFYAVCGEDAERVVELLLSRNIDHQVNLHRVLLNITDNSILDLLIERCVDIYAESMTAQLAEAVLSCWRFRPIIRQVFIVSKLFLRVYYTPRQKVKLFQLAGCIMFLSSHYRGGFRYWMSAINIKEEYQIEDQYSLPYHSLAEMIAALNKDGYSWFRVRSLYFHVMKEVRNLDFISMGVSSLLTSECFRVKPKVEHVYYRYIVECLLYTKWAPATQDQKNKFLLIMVQLCCLLFQSSENDHDKQFTEKIITDLVNLNLKDQHERTVLHLMVITNPEEVDVARVMIEHGADVHARDITHLKPLHTFTIINAGRNSFPSQMFDLFVDRGQHVDEKLNSVYRVHEYLKVHRTKTFREDKYLSLQCLAARVVVDNNISFQKKVPEPIRNFIEIHM